MSHHHEVSRFTGLSPCTILMAQIPTRQRILASQNLWKHEGQVTTQKRTAPSITTKGNRSSTNDRQGRWWMHAQWKQHSLHTTPITCCTSQGYVQAAVGHESFEFAEVATHSEGWNSKGCLNAHHSRRMTAPRDGRARRPSNPPVSRARHPGIRNPSRESSLELEALVPYCCLHVSLRRAARDGCGVQ